MLKIVSSICLLAMLGCSSATYENMSVQDITKRTQKNKNSRVITEFVVRGSGNGDNGVWYLNSKANYKSSSSLNVSLPSHIVTAIKESEGITASSELEGRTIKVTGVVQPNRQCVTHGCPKNTRHYIQTQMYIDHLDNITVLPKN